MSKSCDHFVSHWNGVDESGIIQESDLHRYITEDILEFKYCPSCGSKLDWNKIYKKAKKRFKKLPDDTQLAATKAWLEKMASEIAGETPWTKMVDPGWFPKLDSDEERN